MKIRVDAHRRELHFDIGDMVFLKLQPYRQLSLAKRPCDKLAARFYGPFEVLEKIGAAAYKLKLPDSCLIHPVFHVSQLKKALGSALPPATIPPQLSSTMELLSVPVAVLDVKYARPGSSLIDQVLIRWKDLPDFDATWEHYANVATYFPYFHLEDKVKVWAAGNHTTRMAPPICFTYSRRKGPEAS